MTKLECSALRCLAIVSIVLHNFAHWLPGAVEENEFSFNQNNYLEFWHSLFDEYFAIQFFSFFGHLGVPVFIFLTGYGLARKYDSKKELEWKHFLYNHWRKLFIPLVVGTIIYLLVMYVLEGNLVCSVNRIIVQCLMLLNLISPMHLLPMPYWYFGLTMQLYFIYLLLIHNHSIKPMFFITIASIAFTTFFPDYIRISKFNCIGWFPPLLMGVAFSRFQQILLPRKSLYYLFLFVLSNLLIVVSGFNYYSWLLIPIFVVIAAIAIVKFIPISFQQKMDFIGRNSLYFFVAHPITREIVIPLNRVYGAYMSWCIYLLITFAFVCTFLYIRNHLISCQRLK